jgi:division protein CdvB (Snf7/Vps24/ESCRT-III family)
MKRVVVLLAMMAMAPSMAFARPFGPAPHQYPLLQQQLDHQQIELQSPINRQQMDSLQLQLQQRQSQIQRLEARPGMAAQQDPQLQLLQRQLNSQQLQLQGLRLQQSSCQISGRC